MAAAGVGTRGALYHHFEDKRALFLAVFEHAEQDLIAAAGDIAPVGGAFEVLRGGLLGFLDASLTPEVHLFIANADDKHAAKEQTVGAVDRLLRGLATPAE